MTEMGLESVWILLCILTLPSNQGVMETCNIVCQRKAGVYPHPTPPHAIFLSVASVTLKAYVKIQAQSGNHLHLPFGNFSASWNIVLNKVT